MKPEIETSSTEEIFDLGQQISDDVKNNKFKNGFVIYDNDGTTRIISIFKNKTKKLPLSNALVKELSRYLTEIND